MISPRVSLFARAFFTCCTGLAGLFCLAGAAQAQETADTVDVLITGGQVYDGTGARHAQPPLACAVIASDLWAPYLEGSSRGNASMRED